MKAPQPPIAVVPKLPTGCLAPSKKQPIAVVKNVSEKVAQVFGSDDDDDVIFKHILYSNFYNCLFFEQNRRLKCLLKRV